jgi:hypothetical protein
VRRLSLERVAAGANHVHRSISGMNSSFHFCGGDPFETFSIAKLETPVALSGTTGVASLGENLRLWLRKRQPVHRNLTPPTGSGRRLRLEARLQQSATSCGRLLLSIFSGPPPFPVIKKYSHEGITKSILFSICCADFGSVRDM